MAVPTDVKTDKHHSNAEPGASGKHSGKQSRDRSKGAMWRGLVLLKAERLRIDIEVLRSRDSLSREAAIELDALTDLLAHAEQLAMGHRRPGVWWHGSVCDAAWRRVHEVEARVGALMEEPVREVTMSKVLFDAQSVLDAKDPLLALKPRTESRDRTPERTRELIRRYRSAWDDRYKRGQGYRNRLILMTGIVTLFVAVLVACVGLGLFSFQIDAGSKTPVLDLAPTWDPNLKRLLTVVAVGTFGAIGGLLVGTGPVVQMGGVYNPSFLPWYALFLKIQMGAMCGIVGVMLLLGGFAPQVSLSTWGDVVLWALVFGAAQQLVTFLVDNKVKALITSVPQDQKLLK